LPAKNSVKRISALESVKEAQGNKELRLESDSEVERIPGISSHEQIILFIVSYSLSACGCALRKMQEIAINLVGRLEAEMVHRRLGSRYHGVSQHINRTHLFELFFASIVSRFHQETEELYVKFEKESHGRQNRWPINQ
jgi:hypothetical protein